MLQVLWFRYVTELNKPMIMEKCLHFIDTSNTFLSFLEKWVLSGVDVIHKEKDRFSIHPICKLIDLPITILLKLNKIGQLIWVILWIHGERNENIYSYIYLQYAIQNKMELCDSYLAWVE